MSLLCRVVRLCESSMDISGFHCSAGLTAAVIDETLGGLIYMLKRDGSLPPGPAFTVHLEVDYKAVSCATFNTHVVSLFIQGMPKWTIVISLMQHSASSAYSWCRGLQASQQYGTPFWYRVAYHYQSWPQSGMCMAKTMQESTIRDMATPGCCFVFVSAASVA